MDSQTSRPGPFAPVARAFSDAWLQIRAKPVIYLLIWASLALAPYVLLGLLFSRAIAGALDEFLGAAQAVSAAGGGDAALLSELMGPMARLLGYYGIIWIFICIVGIFNGAVLSETVRQFRERTFPTFTRAISDGASQYLGFFKSVVLAAAKILWKPLTALAAGMGLGTLAGQAIFSSAGFFAGVIFFFSGLYRFGLGPFIHLSLGIAGKDACAVSREFYYGNRPLVSSLFLTTFLAPMIFIFLLFSLIVRTGIDLGMGSLILWFIQSAVQFFVMMGLINFAMNTFPPPESDTL